MEMFNRNKGYMKAIGSHIHEQLTKFPIHLFQLLVKMYELIAEKRFGCLNGKIMMLLK